MSISVVYWSGTGNTQAMAEAVAEGIKAAGQEAELLEVGKCRCKNSGDGRCVCAWMPGDGGRGARRI